jgi:hypothetical protein
VRTWNRARLDTRDQRPTYATYRASASEITSREECEGSLRA